MSSVNPVVVLPEALYSRGEQIAQDTVASLIWDVASSVQNPV